MTEAIIVHIRPFDDNLKSVRRTRLPLKQGPRWRKLFIRVLDLGHKPRLLVARHEEIHFAFLLVPYIKQIEFAKSEIRPPFNGLQQMANDFLGFVTSRFAGCRVVAVGHGIINKAIQSVFYGLPMKEVRPMANCEIRVLELA